MQRLFLKGRKDFSSLPTFIKLITPLYRDRIEKNLIKSNTQKPANIYLRHLNIENYGAPEGTWAKKNKIKEVGEKRDHLSQDRKLTMSGSRDN